MLRTKKGELVQRREREKEGRIRESEYRKQDDKDGVLLVEKGEGGWGIVYIGCVCMLCVAKRHDCVGLEVELKDCN